MQNNTVAPIVFPVSKPLIGRLLARMLEVDGFPVVAATGTIAGKTITTVSTVAPRPLIAEYALMATMAALTSPTEREDVFRQITAEGPVNVAAKLDPDLTKSCVKASIIADARRAAENAYDPGTFQLLTDRNVSELEPAERVREEKAVKAATLVMAGAPPELAMMLVDAGLGDSLKVIDVDPNHGHDPGDEDPSEFRNGIPLSPADSQDTFPAHRIARGV